MTTAIICEVTGFGVYNTGIAVIPKRGVSQKEIESLVRGAIRNERRKSCHTRKSINNGIKKALQGKARTVNHSAISILI